MLMYGSVVWGCCTQTDPLAQVHSCESPESFWGWVDCMHPRSAIEYEIRMMPLVWEACKKKMHSVLDKRVEDEGKYVR